MSFQITLTEYRKDGSVVPLLFGAANIDMPTLLFAYNLELMLSGSCVDGTRFSFTGDAEADLIGVLAGLSWARFEEVSEDARLCFRIEQPGDFLLETRPFQDPRPLLADVLNGGLSESDLLYVLLCGAWVETACSYAAATGWGIRSIVCPGLPAGHAAAR